MASAFMPPERLTSGPKSLHAFLPCIAALQPVAEPLILEDPPTESRDSNDKNLDDALSSHFPPSNSFSTRPSTLLGQQVDTQVNSDMTCLTRARLNGCYLSRTTTSDKSFSTPTNLSS